MTTVLLALLCLFGVVLFIQLGAMVEMYDQLKQVRTHLNMFDRANPLDLGVSHGLQPSGIGLPEELDHAENAVVLFLSNKCATCFEIAADLGGGNLPPNVWLVIVPVSGDVRMFIKTYGLYGDRILTDEDESIVNALGLDITPSAAIVEKGRLVAARTVPTTRQLYALLPQQTPRRVLVPKGADRPE